MRISVSNWQTSQEDVIKTIAGVERVLTAMRQRSLAGSRPGKA
jgi:hypothetical protein